MIKGYSKWHKWKSWKDISQNKFPGVYLLAISDRDISGNGFSWIEEIVYVGRTNSLKGLKGRLRQFDNTIKGKRGHGGAMRFRRKHPDYDKLISKLFVSVKVFKCDTSAKLPQDLRIMGEVAKEEYSCMAKYVEEFGQLPEFNDMKRSPK